MKKNAKKEFGEAIRASIKKEMAKPRMAKSAREGEINLGRIIGTGTAGSRFWRQAARKADQD